MDQGLVCVSGRATGKLAEGSTHCAVADLSEPNTLGLVRFNQGHRILEHVVQRPRIVGVSCWQLVWSRQSEPANGVPIEVGHTSVVRNVLNLRQGDAALVDVDTPNVRPGCGNDLIAAVEGEHPP